MEKSFLDILKSKDINTKWIVKEPFIRDKSIQYISIKKDDKGNDVLFIKSMYIDLEIPLNKMFQQKIKEYDFDEAFKALTEGHIIQSLESGVAYTYYSTTKNYGHCSNYDTNKRTNSFSAHKYDSDYLFNIKEINGKWIIYKYNGRSDIVPFDKIIELFKMDQCNDSCCDEFENGRSCKNTSCLLEYIKEYFDFTEKRNDLND